MCFSESAEAEKTRRVEKAFAAFFIAAGKEEIFSAIL
jgi:hypothetical protein